MRRPRGNIPCVSIIEDEEGAIYFWMYEYMHGENPDKYVSSPAESIRSFVQ